MTQLQTGNERSTRRALRRMAICILLLGILVMFVGIAQGVLSLTVNKRCIKWSEAHDEDYLLYEYDPDAREEQSYRRKFNYDLDGIVTFWDHLHARDEKKEKQCTNMGALATIAAFLYFGCGVVFIVTGSLGLAATKTTIHFKLSELKTAYTVMSIQNSALFGPLLFYFGTAVGLASSLLVQRKSYWEAHSICGGVSAAFGLLLTGLSIASASCVCCSRKTDEAAMVTMTTTTTRQQQMPLQAIPNTYQELSPPSYTPSAPVNSVPASLYPTEKVVELNQEANMVLSQNT